MFSDRKMYPTDYNSAYGILNHLNIEELRDVLNDDNKFEVIVKDFKQSGDIETEKEMLLASNRSLAEYNLTREPDMELAKRQLEELSTEAQQLYKEIEEKAVKLKRKARSYNLETALALLQTAAAEMEEESENIAESFLSGGTDVDGFLEQFMNRRKLMHLRRVKADKMKEMLIWRGSKNSQPQGYPSLYQPPPPLAAVPYPLGPVSSMPTPSHFPLPGQF